MKRTLKPLCRSTAAFTLLEIMLVIIIIVTLMAVLIPSLRSASERSNIGQSEMYVTRLNGELLQYKLANSQAPSTTQGLKALVERPSGEPVPRRWVAFEEEILVDPWGNAYHYENPGRRNPKSFDVFSSGPDGQPNTDDDIGNWK